MTRDEVKEVFKIIFNIYPQFAVTSEKLNIWHKMLSDQDPGAVTKNVERYILNQKFPPTIADLRENKSEARKSDFLKKIEKWKDEAIGYKP